MIEYNKKYYINISPRIYVEVEVGLKKDELNIQPTKNKIELGSQELVKKVDKEELKKKLKKSTTVQTMDKSGIIKNKKRYE